MDFVCRPRSYVGQAFGILMWATRHIRFANVFVCGGGDAMFARVHSFAVDVMLRRLARFVATCDPPDSHPCVPRIPYGLGVSSCLESEDTQSMSLCLLRTGGVAGIDCIYGCMIACFLWHCNFALLQFHKVWRLL